MVPGVNLALGVTTMTGGPGQSPGLTAIHEPSDSLMKCLMN